MADPIARMEIYDEQGNVLVSLSDRVVGGLIQFNTGKVNGSYTVPVPAGMSTEFIYQQVASLTSSGQSTRAPAITVNGNTISWVYNDSGNSFNFVVPIMAVTY